MGSEKCFNAKKFFFLFFSGQWENSGVPTLNFRGTYPPNVGVPTLPPTLPKGEEKNFFAFLDDSYHV